jgi:mRNA interferase YafQ
MQLDIQYTARFLRSLKKMQPTLQEDVYEKVEQFADVDRHKALKVHKLKGQLKHVYSFSVNYNVRIIFQYETNTIASLLDVGTHDVYTRFT